MRGSFSVIMPVYNVEDYVKDAIKSVLNQSYRNFELIIINDGSTDSSGLIAREISNLDKRIRVINREKNKGLSSARNMGIKLSKGDYIYFMDSDDIINNNMFEEIHSIFSMNRVDMVAFTAQPFIDDSFKKHNLNIITINNFYARQFLLEGECSSKDYFHITSEHANFVASACLFVTKRSTIIKGNLKFHEGIIHEDELFTRQLLLASQKRIFFVKNKFYNRRIRNNSITTSSSSLQKASSYLTIAEELNKLFKTTKDYKLQNDVHLFFSWAINHLNQDEKYSKEYHSLIKKIYKSKLSKKYSKDIENYPYIKRRNFNSLISDIRYKLGIRTRMRKLFVIIKTGVSVRLEKVKKGIL